MVSMSWPTCELKVLSQVASEDTGSEGYRAEDELDQLSRALQAFDSDQTNGLTASEDQEEE